MVENGEKVGLKRGEGRRGDVMVDVPNKRTCAHHWKEVKWRRISREIEMSSGELEITKEIRQTTKLNLRGPS